MHVASSKKRSTEQQLIDLQQETLAAVNHLTAVQEQIMTYRQQQLQLMREIAIMKKVKLISKRWYHDESGNWISILGRFDTCGNVNLQPLHH